MKQLLEKKIYIVEVNEIDEKIFKVAFSLRNGYIIHLIICFYYYFPARLPIILIDKEYHKEFEKPHILKDGIICYLDTEGITWNSDPNIVLDLVFERVEDVLIEKNDLLEYHREFNYYFSTLEDLESSISLIQHTDEIKEVNVYTKHDIPIAFFDNDCEPKKTLENLLGSKLLAHKNKAVYIPLDKQYNGKIPQKNECWDLNGIIDLIKGSISSEKLNILESIRANKNNYYYLLKMSLLTGQEVIIGLWYSKNGKSSNKQINPIIHVDSADKFRVHPINIYRYDNTSLLERGGGIISEQKILLVGCGSIGSDILFLLARSGLKKFTLVDNDTLYLENSYRHFLGMNKAVQNKKKVVLLKEEIENRYPSARVETFDKDILDIVREQEINFNDYDLIIIAMGNTNIERMLNKQILETKTAAIFTSVESYGIGGHALLVNNGDKGCYECLFDDDLHNNCSFAEKSDRPYTKNVNGCSGTFTPYGGLDSMQTALTASRLALDFLQGNIKENPLVSWKGNAVKFRENGFQTSNRFDKSLDYLQGYNTDYIRSDCKLCVKGKNKNDS